MHYFDYAGGDVWRFDFHGIECYVRRRSDTTMKLLTVFSEDERWVIDMYWY